MKLETFQITFSTFCMIVGLAIGTGGHSKQIKANQERIEMKIDAITQKMEVSK